MTGEDMSSAQGASATWREPARELPVIGRPDVLVVGAGAAGIAAALASARRGAETWLVERLGYVGGLASFGLINLLLTLDDGEGNQVVAGICQEFVDTLGSLGAARRPDRSEWGSEDPEAVERWRNWGLIWGAPPESVRYSVAFEPESFVNVTYDLLEAEGVTLRLHTGCAATHTAAGSIEAVVVESKAGREVIIPTVIVDTTGDGDVFTYAGADAELVPIYPHQWFRMGGVTGLGDDSPMEGGIYFRTTDPGRVLVPWGGPGFAEARINPVDPVDLTNAELTCRRAVMAEVARLREEAPGFGEAWLDDIAKHLGITESRRLVGDYMLQKEDGGRPFTDSVAQTGHWTKRGVVYDIPYRCLTTPAVENLITAGRCISTTRYVHQATKEIPAAMATGEAAGAAAVAALNTGGRVHAIDVETLRLDLAAGGALVGGGPPADT
ncbi:MAG: FAD-dependent oxidoreductase [Actinomycetia bacterium]|nr:FAD-dependent oxidoreductase [Actinomycetes bacterium]MCP4962293.1 FAD-dependent oxidoreductase [Actinomycetes bacterium]